MSGDRADQFKQNDKLAIVGLLGTVTYLVVLAIATYLGFYFGLLTFEPLGLNEIGDMLAGFFGPIAIFWLVLGFFQQGRELKNSVATLQLQAEELANSVKQQKEMVAVSRETLQHERETIAKSNEERKSALKPKFKVELVQAQRGLAMFSYKPIITNIGAPVTDFTGHFSLRDSNQKFSKVYFGKGETLEGTAFVNGGNYPQNLTFNYSCIDSSGVPNRETVQVNNSIIFR